MQRPNQKTVTTMTDQQVLETLEITLKRHRGKPLHIETKQNIVKDLLRQRQERATLMANNGKRRTTTNQIAIAQRHGVAQSTVSKINKLLTQFLLEKENEETTTATITKTNQQQKQIERLATMLHDKPRGGDREVRARRRKLGSNDGDIAKYILELLDDRCTRYLSEYCDAVRRRFNISVAVSTMHQFIAQFDITRKRTVRLLPRQAFTEKNIAWRKDFIQEWFTAGSFNIDSIATKQEFDDQQNWRLKLSSSTNTNKKKKRNNKQQQQQQRNIFSNKQIFFIDETGVCRHTLRRMFGRSKRGTEARVRHGSFNTSRGANHSTIIAIGAASGVLAHRIIVGANRTTRRTDFCSFLKDVGREMLRAADRAGLPRNAQLYLMMDNASIHKGNSNFER